MGLVVVCTRNGFVVLDVIEEQEEEEKQMVVVMEGEDGGGETRWTVRAITIIKC